MERIRSLTNEEKTRIEVAIGDLQREKRILEVRDRDSLRLMIIERDLASLAFLIHAEVLDISLERLEELKKRGDSLGRELRDLQRRMDEVFGEERALNKFYEIFGSGTK